jgi:uncharacterized protein (DUF3820 family)
MNVLRNFKDLEKLKTPPTKEKQKTDVANIAAIMGKKESIADYRFTFGKHYGKLLKDVAKEDQGYLHWICSTDIDDALRLKLKTGIKKNSYVMSFGQYRGHEISQLAKDSAGQQYLNWVLENCEINDTLRAVIEEEIG